MSAWTEAYDKLRCSCCGAGEPPGGWPTVGSGGTPESLEAYCSTSCFQAHQKGECPCFVDDEIEDGLDGEEPWR